MILENDQIRVDVKDTGEFSIIDKFTGHNWRKPDFQHYVGRLQVEYKGALVNFLLGTSPNDVEVCEEKPNESVLIRFVKARTEGKCIDIELVVKLHLEKESRISLSVELRTLPINYNFSELAYPVNLINLFTAKDDGYLVVPNGPGCIVPTKLAVGFMRYMHNVWAHIADITEVLPFGGGGHCVDMPWYGAFKGVEGDGSGLFVNVQTYDDACLEVVCNSVQGEVKRVGPKGEPREVGRGARVSALTPIWRSSLGEFRYPRELFFEVIPNGTYTKMAKRYREYEKKAGRLKLFDEKILENPNIEKIIGAPNVKIFIAYNRAYKPELRSWDEPVLDGYKKVLTTFNQAESIIRELSEMGIDRALISIEGWEREGFCNTHPDIWPPHEAAGGVKGLRRVCDLANEKGYLIALDDNYQEMFPNSPSFREIERVALRNKDGSFCEGGIWSAGPVIRICSSQALEFANRNLDIIQRELNPTAHYLDTAAATPPVECFSVVHPVSRTEDTKNRQELLNSLKKRKLVVGAEFGTSWAVPVCDYFEGLPGEAVGYYHPLLAPGFGIPIPLFSMVYHDAVVCYWQHGSPYGREDHIDHFLMDLIQGNPSYWVVTTEHWTTMKNLLKTTYKIVSKLHQETAKVELVSHEFVSSDYYVQRVRYANGTIVTVNFGIVDFEIEDGKILPSKGFIIESKEREIKGSFSRDCKVETNKVS